MKSIFLTILISLSLSIFCFGQNNNGDFIELGIRQSKFIESDFLENSKYQNQLNDLNLDSPPGSGLIAYGMGKSYTTKLRYGKQIHQRMHLIAEIGLAKRDEKIICFCNTCDKIPIPVTLVSIKSLDTGIGIRYKVAELKNFNLSLEGIGNYSISTNESNIHYFGYSIHPLIAYKFSKRFKVNLKYGYEQSFKNYKKKERYFELAINYRLLKKNTSK